MVISSDSKIGYCNWFGYPSAVGQDKVVGIATHYRLDRPGIKSQSRQDFSAPIQTGPGPTRHPVQKVLGLFPRSKAARTWG